MRIMNSRLDGPMIPIGRSLDPTRRLNSGCGYDRNPFPLCAACAIPLEGTMMKLDPDEKNLFESFERGEWKPASADEVARMRELARQHLGADVQAGFDALGRGDSLSHDRVARRLAASITSRGRARRTKRR
jgi:hypothetical protein